MDLLLDVNIVLDICAHRAPHAELSAAALVQCTSVGGRLWLYTGSVQTMEYNLISELKRSTTGGQSTHLQLSMQARALLKSFSADKQWLAALSGEGDVFDSEDSEDEQLIRLLEQFAAGSISLLTRDKDLLAKCSRAITPLDFLQKETAHQGINFIDLKKQQDCIRPSIELNMHKVLHHGQYIMGPEIAELEHKLADYVGVKQCITASSGTDTLLIALMALGIGPGDEVITSPFTFIATGEMIVLAGATPVFVDIDPRTYNIDPAKIEAAITLRTKAIMPVSLYGQCADFDTINELVKKHNDSRSTTNDPQIYVIEDGAQSFGATYKGRRSCGLSTIGSTSFFPSKPLGCYGDGGALFTNDDALAKAMREIRAHGQDRRYHHSRLGINGRFDTIQAAVLLAKLDIFPDEVEDRSRIGARYTELFSLESGNSNSRSIIAPYIEPHNISVYAQYTVQVDSRELVQKKMQGRGIPTAVHYPIPLHLQPAFANLGFGEGSFPVSENAGKRVMSLPIHPYLKDDEQKRIVEALLASYAE